MRSAYLLSLMLLTGCCLDCEVPEPAREYSTTQLSKNSVVYELERGGESEAFARYRERLNRGLGHDYELLHSLCERTLEHGVRAWDAEAQLLTVAGAQIAWSDHASHILQQAAYSRHPMVQLNACYALARHGEYHAAAAIAHALGSPHAPMRLEAIRLYVHLQHEDALGQVDALMGKLPPDFAPFFPTLYADMESPQATRRLQRLLHHEDAHVAATAMWSVAQFRRDDLLDDLHQIVNQLDPLRQEAAAAALGRFGDTRALPRLRQLAAARAPLVRLAALRALYSMHEPGADKQLMALAIEMQTAFAVAALNDIAGSEESLIELLRSDSVELRANAALTLLERGDARCLPSLEELLVRDVRDLAVLPTRSPGGALTAWRVIPSSSSQLRRRPDQMMEAVATREWMLRQASRFPDSQFLPLAARVAGSHQRELVPQLIQLLESNGSHQAVALLRDIARLPGRPLERAYASLALYRLHEPGAHRAILLDWLASAKTEDLIEFRPFRPLDAYSSVPYQDLTALETSRLLLDICETFAERQDEAGIAALIDLMAAGNAKNRYVLAGILLRATV